jgi:hypothetical protein
MLDAGSWMLAQSTESASIKHPISSIVVEPTPMPADGTSYIPSLAVPAKRAYRFQ